MWSPTVPIHDEIGPLQALLYYTINVVTNSAHSWWKRSVIDPIGRDNFSTLLVTRIEVQCIDCGLCKDFVTT